MHKKRIVLMYIIIWIVIVIPLSMWAAYMIKDSNKNMKNEPCTEDSKK